MQVVVRIQGNFERLVQEGTDRIAARFREAVGRASLELQSVLRGQVAAAGLGQGLEKAWRRETYPRSDTKRTLRPAALVYSRATALHAAFDAGPTIVAGKQYLVVPSRAAIARGYGATDESRRGGAVPAGRLRRYGRLQQAIRDIWVKNMSFIRRGNGNVLVMERGARGARATLLFTLVRSVRVPRLLDIAAAAVGAEARLRAEIG